MVWLSKLKKAWNDFLEKRRLKKRIKELKKRDPFIYK
jgi:hypothetical protein